MRIAVMGAGAMGSAFGGLLAQSGQDVWLIDAWKEHVEAISKDGLRISEGGKLSTINAQATDDPSRVGPVDLVLLFVKSCDTAPAMRDALPTIGPATHVLTVQNGLGNVEKIGEVVSVDRIFYGMTTLASDLKGPGQVELSNVTRGQVYMHQANKKTSEPLLRVADVLTTAGIHTEVSDNIDWLIWKKLVISLIFNTIPAITRLRVGDVAGSPEAADLVRGVVSEAVQIANRKGVMLTLDEALSYLQEVARVSTEHVPSMLQDVLRKRRTEIDANNGAIVAEGEKYGIPTPYNKAVTHLVRTIETSYSRQVG
ncbi:MAG: 2-dehydropantoate 2-reductase [Chloroflexota bacterium]|nr:MAG: 2-dehydropantoate 2-reductase [Chloroflexota bacterium]